MKKCLDLLYDTGVKIHSLTFDGAQCNLSMCTKLGAYLKLNNPNFSSPHTTSGEPIYLFYDPCHALKLVRNTLGDKRILINSQGEKIEWEYIKKLYLKEKKEGLKVATKLTQKHVYYFYEKMCVKLASQVFSNSVSKNLSFAKILIGILNIL
uniref:THAP domain-containing protein 9 n=1 Tax=Schizaphis graminum TaxID=13262 RepID=A0A2S2NBA2_SCHGA